MKKKLTAALLVLCMAISLFPLPVQAEDSKLSGMEQLGFRQISKKEYAVTPDVREYEWILNNSALTQQMVGHVMEVRVGKDTTASIAVGYGDDNIEAIKSGSSWSMTETTVQAKSMENRRGVNVVGAINAGGYDMSNGRPGGAFIMSGTLINRASSTTFWIDRDGNAHITSAQECNANFDAGNVLEAVSGFGDIFQDGHARSGLDNITRASRTAIGIKADGSVVMLMVDGRQAPYSVGMTMAEVAAAMEELGCVEAVNLDGGGSSTFATQREGEEENDTSAGLTLRCRPSDGYERKVSNTLMVLSSAKPTGTFDHAALMPNNEIYTPGSTVCFTASGIDVSGFPAEIPADAVWTLTEGAALGTIDAQTGIFMGREDAEGKVAAALTVNGAVVGTTQIELHWPDQLGFTNNSVSLDFGQTSDMTFKPTWNGREVRYKDGDFVWTIDEETLSYKHTVQLEEYYTPFWQQAAVRWARLSLPLTGSEKVGDDLHLLYKYDNDVLYDSVYTEAGRVMRMLDNGTIQLEEHLTHKTGTLYAKDDPTQVIKADVTEDFGPTAFSDGKTYGIRNLNAEKSFTFSIGRFSDNQFVADEKTSLRGTVCVALKTNESVMGAVDIVVGMEPYVLMDFEDREVNGTVIPANEYWSCHVGPSAATGKSDNLSAEEVRENRLWVRDTTGKGVSFPTDHGQNQIVSAEQDSSVRFGKYAFKLGFDFNTINTDQAAAADFGFSGDVLVNTVQPTKIGMWINVPEECKENESVLKAILKGGAFESALSTAYMTLKEDGSFEYKDGYQLNGTAAYVQYYSYDAEGKISGATLADWAGHGWIWVEADISAFQMPLDVSRGYTVRVTSPQNCTKGKGYIYIDNLQFIYGTNTNDINNPVIEAVTETGSGTVLYAGEVPEITKASDGALNFSINYSDSEAADKYATGVDTGSCRAYMDGVECTDRLSSEGKTLYLTGMSLRNGVHTLTVYLKDYYGNKMQTDYAFRLSNPTGTEAGIALVPQDGAPEIGKDYGLYIVNVTGEEILDASLEIALPENYLNVLPETGALEVLDAAYEGSYSIRSKRVLVTLSKKQSSALLSTQSVPEYKSELACLVLNVPAAAASDSVFRFTLKKGTYTVSDGTVNTFSGTEQTVVMNAAYCLELENAVVGMPTVLKVTNASGIAQSRAEIYCDEVKIGTTGRNGALAYTFSSPGLKSIYAKKSDGRSWTTSLVVCDKPNTAGGEPFGVLDNAVQRPQTERSITWLSSIDGAQEKAVIRYSKSADLADAKQQVGISEFRYFVEGSSGNALRGNTARLTELEPGTTYYYQVGDGQHWSETFHFTTSAAGAETTRFFVLGDIQTDDTSRLSAALEKLAAEHYDFGVQTGDAIDNVTKLENWKTLFTVVNNEKLNGVPLVHALGNHEYYGDAEGTISGAIYDLPNAQPNGWYVTEYGSVCVVTVNYGGSLADAAAEIAQQLKTDCTWKILVTHEPVYGTTDTLSEETLTAVSSNLEKAGIDFVFSGDDHAYARTYPMIGSSAQPESSRDGIVYYISGDLSGKSNAFTKQTAHAVAMEHNEYQGLYLTAEATQERITITARKSDGTIVDSYTEERTDCELGRHTVTAESLYDMANDTVSCVLCGQYAEAPETFSGLLSTTDGGLTILANGVPLAGSYHQIGETMYHACADGYAHAAEEKQTGTCTTSGPIVYTCPACAAAYRTQAVMPKGHSWDDGHVCKVCGFRGIDIASPDVDVQLGKPEKPIGQDAVGYRYTYKPGGVIPYYYAKHGDTLLSHSSGNGLQNGKIVDLFVEYQNIKQVGRAAVKISGRGDYYGDVELYYYIYPQAPGELRASKVMDTFVKLNWSAASGADQYEVYRCDAANRTRTLVASVGNTTGCTVKDLDMESSYYFVIRAFKEIEGARYVSTWSNVLPVTTNAASTDLTGAAAIVDGQKIDLCTVDGTQYLFLPASADLTRLRLLFERSENKGDLVLSGSRSSVTLDSDGGEVDLTVLTDEENGSYFFRAQVGGGDALMIHVMQASGLPTLYLTSTDEAQNRDYVDASKTNKAKALALMTDPSGSALYSGSVKQLKARGNSTFLYADKKSYQIKLSDGADLLGTGEQVKTWVLLAGYFDATQMHDKLVKDLAAEIGLDYTASCGWVNLYYDGEYRGIYLLSEKNGVSETSVDINRLEDQYDQLNKDYGTDMEVRESTNRFGNTVRYTENIQDPWRATDGTGGYLLEMNYHTLEEASSFMTSQGYAINVKTPEWCGKDAMDYISEYYQGFEDAVYAQNDSGEYTGYNQESGLYYYDYVDLDSLVKIFLLQEISKNCDGFRYSQYFYFTEGKLYAGPVWDQEMTFGTGWSRTSDPGTMEYFDLGEALIRIPHFRAAVQSAYADFRAAAGGLKSSVDAQYALLCDSAAMNYVLWPYIRTGSPSAADHLWKGASYASVIDELQRWIAKRLSKLDEVYADRPESMLGDVDGDGEITADDARMIRQYLVGMIELTDAQRLTADVDRDGEVTADDARMIRQYLVGIIDRIE